MKYKMGFNQGAITNGKEPRSCLGQVFNCKLGSFTDETKNVAACKWPLWKLQTRPRFCPLSWSLSMLKVNKAWLRILGLTPNDVFLHCPRWPRQVGLYFSQRMVCWTKARSNFMCEQVYNNHWSSPRLYLDIFFQIYDGNWLGEWLLRRYF